MPEGAAPNTEGAGAPNNPPVGGAEGAAPKRPEGAGDPNNELPGACAPPKENPEGGGAVDPNENPVVGAGVVAGVDPNENDGAGDAEAPNENPPPPGDGAAGAPNEGVAGAEPVAAEPKVWTVFEPQVTIFSFFQRWNNRWLVASCCGTNLFPTWIRIKDNCLPLSTP